MPSLEFTLPHWAYGFGLVLFPLLAMYLARRGRPDKREYRLPLAYLVFATGGIIGLHRLYLKNLWGLLYIPVFVFILFANSMENDARSDLSDASNLVRVAERTLERDEPRVAEARAALPEIEAELAAAEPESFTRRSAERRLQRAQDQIATGEANIERARADLAQAAPVRQDALERRAFWDNMAGYAFYLILLGMLIDAVLMPFLVSRANMNLALDPDSDVVVTQEERDAQEAQSDARFVTTGWTGWIDRVSLFSGEFVSYWAVIAVFVYYYEVIARYVFNSPTNWAHEGMYLMFGMQYLIAGSYAMLTESHVRVDIFYAPLSRVRKAWVDLATSVFFFIFAGTLLVTSYIFAFDSIAVPSGNGLLSDWARSQISFGQLISQFSLAQFTDPAIRWGEISFNEWEVPLWPMKMMMILGGLLLVLQGISKLAQDIRAIARGE